ncbi:MULTISPECIES: DUF2933 domain-containing protein [unclassified Castellaniella]|jgi:hypothetical protein|uniref:DUF2933 domain-containing protein n=1 Tax=Castellaniella TaxID=359336 RepID=UPI000A036898
MAWLTENWIWVLFGVAFIAMHLFGHGCHGGHGGGHGSGSGEDRDANRTADPKAVGNPPSATGGSREPHPH